MKQNDTYYGIGDTVPLKLIESINDYYNEVGINSFWEFIYYGGFPEYVEAYIHPSDDMRDTPMFNEIQQAYISAYV